MKLKEVQQRLTKPVTTTCVCQNDHQGETRRIMNEQKHLDQNRLLIPIETDELVEGT